MPSSPRPDKSAAPETTGARRPLRLWKEPLIHFFVLGLIVFALHGIFEREEERASEPDLVEVTSADIDWFRTMWRKRMGREPTLEELREHVNQLVRDQILSREAVSMGLDKGDTVVRRHLAQKVNFLFQGLAETAQPSESDLEAFLQENPTAYETPGRISFTHVYFDVDARGENAAAAAVRSLVRKLNASGRAPQGAADLGDAFLLPSRYAGKPLPEVRSEFGPEFAAAIAEQEPGAWSGPVPSGYGLHAVYIDQRTSPSLPEFGELKDRLTTDWLAARQRELVRDAYEEVRNRYQVLVEGMPYNTDQDG